MDYNVIYLDDLGEEHILKTIDELEFHNLLEKKEWLNSIILYIEFYRIIVDNLLDLEKALKSFSHNVSLNFSTANRYTYNALNTFYAFVEYCEHNYKDFFTPLKSQYYDNHFEYRLLYNLRIYMTHCEMAISHAKSNPSIPNSPIKVCIYISDLITNGNKRIQKRFISELKKRENEKSLELLPIISDFINIFTSLYQDLLKMLEPNIQEIIKYLDSNYLKINNSGNYYSSIIINNSNGKFELMLTSYISKFIQKINNLQYR